MGDYEFQSLHIKSLKFSSFWPKNYKTHKESGKCGPYTGKAPSTKTVPEKARTLDLLDQDFKYSITDTFKEWKKITPKDLKHENNVSWNNEFQKRDRH